MENKSEKEKGKRYTHKNKSNLKSSRQITRNRSARGFPIEAENP